MNAFTHVQCRLAGAGGSHQLVGARWRVIFGWKLSSKHTRAVFRLMFVVLTSLMNICMTTFGVISFAVLFTMLMYESTRLRMVSTWRSSCGSLAKGEFLCYGRRTVRQIKWYSHNCRYRWQHSCVDINRLATHISHTTIFITVKATLQLVQMKL